MNSLRFPIPRKKIQIKENSFTVEENKELTDQFLLVLDNLSSATFFNSNKEMWNLAIWFLVKKSGIEEDDIKVIVRHKDLLNDRNYADSHIIIFANLDLSMLSAYYRKKYRNIIMKIRDTKNDRSLGLSPQVLIFTGEKTLKDLAV